MSDIPEDLTTVGTHHGNPPPTDTGQEVRSPEGPDPTTSPATPSTAQFQLVRTPEQNRIQVRTHSPRATELPEPDGDTEDLGTYRSVDALRSALVEASIAGSVAVFEDAEADDVLTDTNVTADHAWIGRPRYRTITFFSDQEAADEYVRGLDRSDS